MSAPRIGVVGAGLMGCQLAGAIAMHAQPVVLVDPSDEARRTALARVRSELRDAVIAGGLAVRASEVAARVELAADHAALEGCAVVVECTRESLAPKRESVRAICAAAPDAVVAINTSCIPIALLVEGVACPGRVLGAHFMNPVALRPAVEVAVGALTEASAVHALEAWLSTLGKRAIRVGDAPGFVSNRVLMLMVNEAVAVLEAGTADARTVDRVFTECMGHALGPLATIDLIGVDTVVLSLEVLEATLGDARFRPRPLLYRLMEQGHLGRKTGRGIHEHE